MKLRAHILFILAIPVFLILAHKWPNSAIDIQMHDTYVVVAYAHIAMFIALIFAFFGLAYEIAENRKWPLINFLSQFHVWTTLIFVLIFYVYEWFGLKNYLGGVPRMYYSFDRDAGADFLGNIKLFLFALLFLFILAQIFFFINMAIGIFRKVKKQVE